MAQLLIPAAAGAIGALIAAGLFLFLWGRRLERTALTVASITRINPYFKRQSPIKTQFVRCSYAYSEKRNKKQHEGECFLPVRYFVKTVLPPGPIIIFDLRINMPVLVADDVRAVGEEAIEHALLQFEDHIKISYLKRDPSRSVPTDFDAGRMRSPNPMETL